MSNQQQLSHQSAADYRQQLVQTLAMIVERERQWLTQLESYADESIRPLMAYMANHISILKDTYADLPSEKYQSAPVNQELDKMICVDIARSVEFAMASHQRACIGINQTLIAKEITGIKLEPLFV